MAANAPLADLQRKVLLTQPVTLFQRQYAPDLDLPLVDDELACGSGATATAEATSATAVAVTITAGGNYTAAPDVLLTGGSGSYTSATATLNSSGAVTGVTVSGAAGYVANETLTVEFVAFGSVGTSPWREDLYGREGLKTSKAQEVMRYKGSRSLGDIAAVRTSDELMLDLTLYDASIEAMAFLLDQDVRETRAATSTVGQIQRVGMSRPATMREYTFVIRGSAVQDPVQANVRAGQFVVPRGRIISPYERNQTVTEWVKSPVQIVALVDFGQASELDRLGWFEELGETT